MTHINDILAALTPLHLALAVLGVAAGTILGAIPGLTATMAIAVLVPLTFSMDPTTALLLMGAIYTGAIYGGAYAAILLNTPGTPSAIATTFDGYPMAKRGDGDLAVTIACLSSVFGGLVGAAVLLFLAPPLANVALAFGPVEYFWLAIFGLTLISAISSGQLLKGLIGASFGLLLSCVGVAPISGTPRFTFDSTTLLGGIDVVSGLIGLYCIPVLINLVARPERHLEIQEGSRGFRLAGSDTAVYFRRRQSDPVVADRRVRRHSAGRRRVDLGAGVVFRGAPRVEDPRAFRPGRAARYPGQRIGQQRHGRRRHGARPWCSASRARRRMR